MTSETALERETDTDKISDLKLESPLPSSRRNLNFPPSVPNDVINEQPDPLKIHNPLHVSAHGPGSATSIVDISNVDTSNVNTSIVNSYPFGQSKPNATAIEVQKERTFFTSETGSFTCTEIDPENLPGNFISGASQISSEAGRVSAFPRSAGGLEPAIARRVDLPRPLAPAERTRISTGPSPERRQAGSSASGPALGGGLSALESVSSANVKTTAGFSNNPNPNRDRDRDREPPALFTPTQDFCGVGLESGSPPPAADRPPQEQEATSEVVPGQIGTTTSVPATPGLSSPADPLAHTRIPRAAGESVQGSVRESSRLFPANAAGGAASQCSTSGQAEEKVSKNSNSNSGAIIATSALISRPGSGARSGAKGREKRLVMGKARDDEARRLLEVFFFPPTFYHLLIFILLLFYTQELLANDMSPAPPRPGECSTRGGENDSREPGPESGVGVDRNRFPAAYNEIFAGWGFLFAALWDSPLLTCAVALPAQLSQLHKYAKHVKALRARPTLPPPTTTTSATITNTQMPTDPSQAEMSKGDSGSTLALLGLAAPCACGAGCVCTKPACLCHLSLPTADSFSTCSTISSTRSSSSRDLVYMVTKERVEVVDCFERAVTLVHAFTID